MGNLKAIVLAAGEGKRMKSNHPKVVHKILDQPMISYVVDAVKKTGATAVCVVIGHKGEEVKSAITEMGVEYALQEKLLGTGHAVMQAKNFLEDESDILILYGDTPLITSDTLKDLISFHREEKNDASMISVMVPDPTGYGHIIRDADGAFLKNIEDKDAVGAEKQVKEINTGFYCFKGGALRKALDKLTNNNKQKEYYLPDTLQIILQEGGRVNAFVAESADEFLGVNSRVQLSQATESMKRRINRMHMENGVTIVDPENTYISSRVTIGMDTIIYPGCVLEGETKIGEACEVGPHSKMVNITLGDRVAYQSSTGFDSSIGSDTSVGPYAHIRPNCKIGCHVKIGDFVEIKNSTIGDNTKIPHLTYIGDSDLGKKINIGCGTVTVNYDGKKKFRTVVEDNCFIGCNANLVAPVTVQEGSYVAAGSTITKDVPPNVLAIARGRQQVIEGWLEKRK